MRQTIKNVQQKAQADRKERDFLAKLQAIKDEWGQVYVYPCC